MAEYITFQPRDYFNTTIWTGNSTDDRAITGVGFSPNFVWIKDRTAVYRHLLFDTLRGATYKIESSDSDAQTTETDSLKSFDADGYTLGTGSPVNTASTYVGWNWNAGTTSVPSGGSITPSGVSYSATSGISIITYTGTGATSNTIAHGLGAVPKFMIFKNLDAIMDWATYHEAMGNTDYMILNTAAAEAASTTRWNDTSPTSTLFTIGNTDKLNSSGVDYVAYVFADVRGYSKFSSYKGNGNADGPFVYTGFRPAWLMIKSYSATGYWMMYDNKREGYNEANDRLIANTTAIEGASAVDILSNGFKLRGTDTYFNGSGTSYTYMAFAEFPIVSSNDIPGTAR
jgi:hypothetical protein